MSGARRPGDGEREEVPRRPVKTLVKVLALAALAASALGGAAALGSTLFQSPPRDAAEFAARVDEGSTHWDDLESDEAEATPAATKPVRRTWKGRPVAERRFLRALDRICLDSSQKLDGLEKPRRARARAAYLTRWLHVSARYQKRARKLDRPKRLERRTGQLLGLWDDAEARVRELRKVVRRHDSFLMLLLMDELDSIGQQTQGVADSLDITSCLPREFADL
jgi:hypothetical protein